jgi:hypothetical protein
MLHAVTREEFQVVLLIPLIPEERLAVYGADHQVVDSPFKLNS